MYCHNDFLCEGEMDWNGSIHCGPGCWFSLTKRVKVGMVFSYSYNYCIVIRLIRLGLLQLPHHTPESYKHKSYLSLFISVTSAFSIQVCC